MLTESQFILTSEWPGSSEGKFAGLLGTLTDFMSHLLVHEFEVFKFFFTEVLEEFFLVFFTEVLEMESESRNLLGDLTDLMSHLLVHEFEVFKFFFTEVH